MKYLNYMSYTRDLQFDDLHNADGGVTAASFCLSSGGESMN